MAKSNIETPDQQILDALDDQPIMVYEDVQGSRFFANWNGIKWTFKAKSITNHPLTQFDLLVQRYWGKAVDHFMRMKPGMCDLLNHKWWFCFEYFPDNEPAHVEYDEIPESGLVLTWIVKEDGNLWTQHLPELYEYSQLFRCDVLPVIFYGKLSDKQSELLKAFLNTSPEDLDYIFGEDNFLQFFYKVLAPQRESSFLMDKDRYNDNVEKLMLRFQGESQELRSLSMELLNPFYSRVSSDASTDYMAVYSMILLAFMETANMTKLQDIELKSDTDNASYVEIITHLYKEHVARASTRPEDWEFKLPRFYYKEKHQLNIDAIKDDELRRMAEESPRRGYVLKTVLNAFTKPMKKPVGLFTEVTQKEFNRLQQDIHTAVRKHLGVKKLVRTEMPRDVKHAHSMLDPKHIGGDRKIYLPQDEPKVEPVKRDRAKKKGNKFKSGGGKVDKDNIF